MKPVTISQARRIAEATGARAVIILAVDDADYTPDVLVAGASYGVTNAECGSVAKTLDALVDRVLGMSVPMPEVR